VTAALVTFAGSFAVGVVGAVLGVGGGVFLVPFLVFAAGLRPIEAVGISLFCVVGTSIGGASKALRDGQANLRLALTLEPIMLVTSVGASLLVQRASDALILGLFGAVMLIIAGVVRASRGRALEVEPPEGEPRFWDGVVDEPGKGHTPYRPRKMPALLSVVGGVGFASGFFGLGGGVMNVPALALLARVPMRAAASTSVLTMCVTGAAAGAVHLSYGHVPAGLVGASLLGVVPGGMIGARLMRRFDEQALRTGFALLALFVSAASLWRAWEMAR
jgi:uncharacterized membrane protein YfcA